MDDEFVDLSARIIREHEEATLPEGTTARQFLPMVMRGEIDPEPRQMNAAKVLIEYEEPKLSAVGVAHMDGQGLRISVREGYRAQQATAPACGAIASARTQRR